MKLIVSTFIVAFLLFPAPAISVKPKHMDNKGNPCLSKDCLLNQGKLPQNKERSTRDRQPKDAPKPHPKT